MSRWPLAALMLLASSCEEPLEVVVRQGGTEVLRVEVDLAETAEERIRGLRGQTLAPGTGLLIVLPGPPDEVCIANDGVDFAIDALFIADAAVTAIERDVAAGDATDRCHDADHILELRSGEAAAVDRGNSVELPQP